MDEINVTMSVSNLLFFTSPTEKSNPLLKSPTEVGFLLSITGFNHLRKRHGIPTGISTNSPVDPPQKETLMDGRWKLGSMVRINGI